MEGSCGYYDSRGRYDYRYATSVWSSISVPGVDMAAFVAVYAPQPARCVVEYTGDERSHIVAPTLEEAGEAYELVRTDSLWWWQPLGTQQTLRGLNHHVIRCVNDQVIDPTIEQFGLSGSYCMVVVA